MNREFGLPTKLEIIIVSVSESIRKGEFAEGQVIPRINQALTAAKNRINKYNRLILSFPGKSGHSQSLKKGFLKFVNSLSAEHQITNSLDDFEICRGDAYLVIDNANSVKLLRVCKARQCILGNDVGVIAYNETPLKEVIPISLINRKSL